MARKLIVINSLKSNADYYFLVNPLSLNDAITRNMSAAALPQ